MWSSLTFTLLVTCAISQITSGQQGCTNPAEIMNCVMGLDALMPSGAAPIQGDLDQVCKSLTTVVECLKTKIAACIPDESQRADVLKKVNFDMISNTVAQMCKDDGKLKTVYKKHKECLMKNGAEMQALCPSKAPQPGVDPCVTISVAGKCYSAATENACGCEASEYPRETIRIMQDALKATKPCDPIRYDTTAKCKDYQYPSYGAGNSLRATFPFLIISILFILI